MYYNKDTNKVAYTFPPYHIGNPLGTRVSGGLSFLFVTSNLTAARKYGGSVAPLHHSMCTGSVRPARTRRRRVRRMRGSPLGTRVSGGLSFLPLQTKKPQKDSSTALRMTNRVTRFSVTSSVIETSLPPPIGCCLPCEREVPRRGGGIVALLRSPLRKGDLLLPFLKKAPLVKGGLRYS